MSFSFIQNNSILYHHSPIFLLSNPISFQITIKTIYHIYCKSYILYNFSHKSSTERFTKIKATLRVIFLRDRFSSSRKSRLTLVI